jgi:hypothetical protein
MNILTVDIEAGVPPGEKNCGFGAGIEISFLLVLLLRPLMSHHPGLSCP